MSNNENEKMKIINLAIKMNRLEPKKLNLKFSKSAKIYFRFKQ